MLHGLSGCNGSGDTRAAARAAIVGIARTRATAAASIVAICDDTVAGTGAWPGVKTGGEKERQTCFDRGDRVHEGGQGLGGFVILPIGSIELLKRDGQGKGGRQANRGAGGGLQLPT